MGGDYLGGIYPVMVFLHGWYSETRQFYDIYFIYFLVNLRKRRFSLWKKLQTIWLMKNIMILLLLKNALTLSWKGKKNWKWLLQHNFSFLTLKDTTLISYGYINWKANVILFHGYQSSTFMFKGSKIMANGKPQILGVFEIKTLSVKDKPFVFYFLKFAKICDLWWIYFFIPFLQMGHFERGTSRTKIQIGRITIPAVGQSRCRRHWGLDQREATNCYRRVLQGSFQHSGMVNKSSSQSQNRMYLISQPTKVTLEEWVFVESTFNRQCYIVKNALLQTAFSLYFRFAFHFIKTNKICEN